MVSWTESIIFFGVFSVTLCHLVFLDLLFTKNFGPKRPERHHRHKRNAW